jgi:hypothetical protein
MRGLRSIFPARAHLKGASVAPAYRPHPKFPSLGSFNVKPWRLTSVITLSDEEATADDKCQSLPRHGHGSRSAAGKVRTILAQPAALSGVRGHGPEAAAQERGLAALQ